MSVNGHERFERRISQPPATSGHGIGYIILMIVLLALGLWLLLVAMGAAWHDHWDKATFHLILGMFTLRSVAK